MTTRKRGLHGNDRTARALLVVGAQVRQLEAELDAARVARRDAAAAALGAGASWRWVAGRLGVSLGALQRLMAEGNPRPAVVKAAAPTTAPAVLEPAVPSPATDAPVCRRHGCGVPAAPGRILCDAHHHNAW